MFHKIRKIIYSAIAVSTAVVLAGCSGSSGPVRSFFETEDTTNDTASTTAVTSQPVQSSGSETNKPFIVPFSENDIIKSFSMQVNKDNGQLNITRADEKNKPMGDPGTWTIYVYMCGSDLESDNVNWLGGSATDDINEMLNSAGNDKVKFVVETGGTSQWQNDVISNTRNEVYLIQKGSYELVADSDSLNMGDSFTLADFLKWGVTNYPAEHMGIVLWNHGGGSIDGVCFDELHDNDSLSLRELDSALLSVYQDMTDRFEFIGFDACLMSTVETANIAATYADYMYASQEIESGTGWDYTAISNYLSANPDAGGDKLGKKVADSFIASCKEGGDDNDATFSIIDLRKFDDFSVAFNDYCRDLYDSIKGGDGLNEVIRGVYSSDYFGGNSEFEGYFNMVDLGGVINAGSKKADSSKVLDVLSKCVCYNVNGPDHRNASGLSIYYPLHINGSMELSIFSDICVNPYYLSLVDLLRTGYSSDGYDNDNLFGDDGLWYSGGEYGYDNDSGDFFFDNDYSDSSYEYWDYPEDAQENDSTQLITFAQAPHIDENYNYTFTLDNSGYYYTADVTAYVYRKHTNGDIIMLGETHDVNADWSTGTFSDVFDGEWLSLPDGQNLELFVSDSGNGYISYLSPIYFNGTYSYMKIRQDARSTQIEGIYSADSGTGAAYRNGVMPNKGDIIKPYYDAFDTSGKDKVYEGHDYIYDPSQSFGYATLDAATYYYSFCITDIYGGRMTTELQEFIVDESGKVYYNNGSGGYTDYDYDYDYDSDDYWSDYWSDYEGDYDYDDYWDEYWDDYDWDDYWY